MHTDLVVEGEGLARVLGHVDGALVDRAGGCEVDELAVDSGFGLGRGCVGVPDRSDRLSTYPQIYKHTLPRKNPPEDDPVRARLEEREGVGGVQGHSQVRQVRVIPQLGVDMLY